MDFNDHTVAQIFTRYRGNATRVPRRGTSGYIFTFDERGTGHLQVYDRGRNQRDYTRYSNGSYTGTDSTYRAHAKYRPNSVKQQYFVPLNRCSAHWSYYR